MKEASEQSGRATVPEIVEPVDFKNAIKLSKANDLTIFYDPSGVDIFKIGHKVKRIGDFIGPEGGWSSKEVSMAKVARFEIASFGKLIYRAETAAIVAVYDIVKTLR